MYFHPALSCLLAWALRGEAMSSMGVVGVVGSLAGVVLVAQPPFLFNKVEPSAAVPWTLHHIIGRQDLSAAMPGCLMPSAAAF